MESLMFQQTSRPANPLRGQGLVHSMRGIFSLFSLRANSINGVSVELQFVCMLICLLPDGIDDLNEGSESFAIGLSLIAELYTAEMTVVKTAMLFALAAIESRDSLNKLLDSDRRISAAAYSIENDLPCRRLFRRAGRIISGPYPIPLVRQGF